MSRMVAKKKTKKRTVKRRKSVKKRSVVSKKKSAPKKQTKGMLILGLLLLFFGLAVMVMTNQNGVKFNLVTLFSFLMIVLGFIVSMKSVSTV